MVEIRVDTNADEVAADIRAYGVRATAGTKGAAQNAALLVETRTKANASLPASGPPGPRAITGDYRASWNTQKTEETPDSVTFTVGTDRPQGRRLEYGFVGRDALGRVYNQPPYPHLQPAIDATRPEFEAAVRKAATP